MNEALLYYWLSLSGASDKKLNTLIGIYSPYEIWCEIVKSEKIKEFLGEKATAALIRFRSESFLLSQLDKIADKGIGIVAQSDERFPRLIRQKEVCPPMILYYKGDLSLTETTCVAVVGTRACSHYGKEVTEMLVRDLTESGATIVSGLATGIDGYAHAQCLASGGRTIAVLGGGLDFVTPVSNINLSLKIQESGLLLSQYPPQSNPTRYTFPERNRLISGLSIGVVVVEADVKSGALITADFALEQGREVFAVPGNITSIRSRGTNNLIAKGATVVTSANDIIAALRLKMPKKENSSVLALDIFEEKIYTLLQSGDKTMDELIALSGMKASEISSTVTSMEIKGIIIRRANEFGIR